MSPITESIKGPHQGQPVLYAGEPLGHAQAAMVMLHGRGATAQDILLLAGELAHPGFAYLAPQAAQNTWYPNRFTVPLKSNEPWLSSALAIVEAVLSKVSVEGIPLERTMLLGFSQGACLALEYAARHAKRYGGLAGLSGGLIGPDGTPREYAGTLAGTPVFLGCSDADFHIHQERVVETAQVLEALGGRVTLRLYPGLGHQVNRDEIDSVQAMMTELLPE